MTIEKSVLSHLLHAAVAAVGSILLLSMLSGSANAAVSHPGPPCSPGVSACLDMYIVAHQDDDLLFMNPDMQTSIASGNHVVTVFTTNGCVTCDGSTRDVQYWVGRADGGINAYTYMATPSQASTSQSLLPSGWTYRPITVENTQIATYQYQGGANITLVFLQIPDIAAVDETIKWLWEAPGAEDDTLSCLNLCPYGVPALPVVTYTRQHLIDVLAGLMTFYNADSVSTTDGTNLYQSRFDGPDGITSAPENPSHFFSGLFTTAAIAQAEAKRSGPPRVLRLYRGYTILNEPENLSDEEAFPKLKTFARYAMYDADVSPCSDSTLDSPHFCDANGNTYTPYQTDYPHRKYVTRQLQASGSLSGRLMTTAGSCLLAAPGGPTVGACNQATSWSLTTHSQLNAGSACLDAISNGDSDQIALHPCASPVPASQTFRVFGNGQIRTFDGYCLEGASGPVTALPCDRETESTSIYACTDPTFGSVPCPLGIPVPAQNWTLIFDNTFLLSTQFSDSTEIPSASYYYRTFAMASNQICVRRALGVMCAPYGVNTLGPGVYLQGGFPDSDGWASDPNGSTVRAFVQGGTTTACGRGYYGVGCTSGLSTSDYSNDQGWAGGVWDYGSIRYLDLNGDGQYDICGRGYYGISCALASGSTFAPATLWTQAYDASTSWNQSPYGESIQFGDLNGDGYPDVCGRSIYGMECASNALPSATAFNHGHNWSWDADRNFPRTVSGSTVVGEFSDLDPLVSWGSQASYYRTLQFVDINHDGLADLCGRGPGGIYCALSTGTGFEPRRNVLPFDFTDTLGWQPDSTGSTITFGQLDGGTRTWVCGRGNAGVICAKGY